MTTEPITEEAVYDDPHNELPPPRPRRKRLGRGTLALIAVLIAACGFIGGVQVQKGQQDDQAGGFPAGLSGPPTGGGGGGLAVAGGGDAVTGEVANVKDKILYVTTPDGDTIAVKPTSSSTITRNADAKIGAIRPGDNVVVQGAEKPSGAVEATSIAATAAGVDAVGAFMRPPTSASGENGDETSGDVDALFQP
jgi:hypothetical protein